MKFVSLDTVRPLCPRLDHVGHDFFQRVEDFSSKVEEDPSNNHLLDASG